MWQHTQQSLKIWLLYVITYECRLSLGRAGQALHVHVCVCGGGRGRGGAIETYLVVWHPIICTSLEVNNNIISSVLHANVQPATILKFSKAKSRPLQQVVAKTMPNLNHEERISWRYLSSWKSDGVPNLIIS